jgi:hypothetical protein
MRLDKHVNAYKPIANHVANIQYEKQKKVQKRILANKSFIYLFTGCA